MAETLNEPRLEGSYSMQTKALGKLFIPVSHVSWSYSMLTVTMLNPFHDYNSTSLTLSVTSGLASAHRVARPSRRT